MSEEIDIPLSEDEKREKIEFLKKMKFKDFEMHRHYTEGVKHCVELEDIENVYPQFDKIIYVFKRHAKKGYKYCFIYKLEETKSLYLFFLLDKNPPVFFNAYYDYTRQEKKLKKKVQRWLRREYFNRRS